jgi:hypothetical protein
MSAQAKYTIFQIKPAKDSEINKSAMSQILSALKSSLKASWMNYLLGNFETVSLEIVNLNQTSFFVIACPERLEHLIRSQIVAQYPNSLISKMEDYLPTWLSHGQVQAGTMTLTAPAYLPINISDEKGVDQLASTLGALGRLNRGQAAIIQMCLFSAPKNWQKHARSLMETTDSEGKVKAHPQKSLIEQKVSDQSFATDIRLVAIADQASEAKTILSNLSASFGTYSLSEGNSFKLTIPKDTSQQKLIDSIANRNVKYADPNQYLTYSEISAIFHLPNIELSSLKNIAWGKTIKGEAPSNLVAEIVLDESEKSEVNFFAKTEFRNTMTMFGMAKGLDRRRHIYVLGKSGTGKSTLLGGMAINDIRKGEGMALIDPHGDLAGELLDYIPRERIDDVVYLDPSRQDMSFRLNPLKVKDPSYREAVASSIVSIFIKLYGHSWGPRLEYLLRNCLLTLVNIPNPTLLEVPHVLTSREFREECLKYVDDPVILNFWRDEYDKYSEKFQTEAIAPILNKVGQFITSPTIRNILSHPDSTIDLETLMNQNKIILINLPQGKIGEDNATLLGGMIISQIQIAAMNRARIPENERKDFFLYVDEFQNFATTAFIKILSEARKYKLNLILANQYTAQLPEEIQKAIFGNAGTIISFVVGAEDANRISGELGNTYTQDDLVSLQKYQIVTKISIGGGTSLPFPAYTIPMPEDKNNHRDEIIKIVDSKYYRPIEAPNIKISEPSAQQGGKGKRTGEYGPPTPPAEYNGVEPDIAGIEAVRSQGFQPVVMSGFLQNDKILLLHQRTHNNWQLPQSNLQNKTALLADFAKIVSSEVGPDFAKSSQDILLIGDDQIEFPPDVRNTKQVKLDSGAGVDLVGKKYYFFTAKIGDVDVQANSREYDQYVWVGLQQAKDLVKTTNVGGKLRITDRFIDHLGGLGLLKDSDTPATPQIVGISSRPPRPAPSYNSRPPDNRPQRSNNPPQSQASSGPTGQTRSSEPSTRSNHDDRSSIHPPTRGNAPLPARNQRQTPNPGASASPSQHSKPSASSDDSSSKRSGFKLPQIRQPDSDEIDRFRKAGLRPTLVACFTQDNKIMLVHQKEHQNWQLPQGGLNNNSDLLAGLATQIKSDLGVDLDTLHITPNLVASDTIEFPPDKHGTKDMKLDDGSAVIMKGKRYYFYHLPIPTLPDFKLNSELDKYQFVKAGEAIDMIKQTNSGGKLRILSSVIHLLSRAGHLSSSSPTPSQDGRPPRGRVYERGR